MSVAAAAIRSKKASVVSHATLTLAGVEQEFAGLKTWTIGEEAFGLPFDEVERVIEVRGREVMRQLLQAHVEARGRGDVGPAVVVATGEAGGTVLHGERRIHTRKVTSIFGKVRVDRRAYHRDGTPAIRPLDEDLELPSRSHSYELQRRVVVGAVRGPFQEVCESVEETTGVRVSKRSAEDLVQDAAQDFEAFYEQRTPPPGEATGAILVAALDGKGVPMVKEVPAGRVARRKKGEKANKKRMATVAAVHSQQPFMRTPEEIVERLFPGGPRLHDTNDRSKTRRPEHKRVWASLTQGKAEVIGEVDREWARRDPDKTKTRVVLTDGDKALQRACRKGLKGATFILDLMHALEYLWEAAYLFHPEGSSEAVAWVKERALRILQGNVGQVVKGLRQMATKRAFRGEKREGIRRTTNYLYRNRRFMRYGEYLAKGLPIASGVVEGACKNLVKDRMERSGMRWTEASAEAVLKLRAVERSSDFESYWGYHATQEQHRLHPPGRWSPVHEGIGK